MIIQEPFTSPTTQAIRFILSNEQLEIHITNYGATILAIFQKDYMGSRDSIVLGHATLSEYEQDNRYFGALVGRCAGRIADGKFTLHDTHYTLATNNGKHHLHGGTKGFSHRLFDALIEDDKLHLHYVSCDNEEGYPGNVHVHVIYMLVQDTLTIHYQATSDADTLMNLTNHSYFNLHGHHRGDINDIQMWMQASTYCPNTASFLSDQPCSVSNTPFDFRTPSTLKEHLHKHHPQLEQANGIDHYFPFDTTHDQVHLFDPISHRHLAISTTSPGAQIYTPFYSPSVKQASHPSYFGRCAICVETQAISNSINDSKPNVIVKANECYEQITAFTFTLKESI